MKFSILPVLFLFTSFRLFSQPSKEEFKSALMQKKDGAEVVYSSNQHSFTLDIISNNLKPLDEPGFILVDNKTLQFIFIGNNASKKYKNTAEEQKSQLLGYMQYELDYAKNDLKLEYSNPIHEFITINDKLFLLWYYDMPVENKSVLKQINLSTLCFEHVLNLNTPFVKDDNFEDDKGLLTRVAQTLKQNDYKIDFEVLYKKLHGE